MCKDVKILHYLTSLIIFVWICRLHWSKHNKVSSPSSRIGCRQELFRCYFGYSVRGLDLVKHLSECQWHFIISPPFHHSPLQSRRKQRPGLITSLFCLEVWTLIWIAITSMFSNVFWTVCGFMFWHVLTHYLWKGPLQMFLVHCYFSRLKGYLQSAEVCTWNLKVWKLLKFGRFGFS